MTENDVLLQQTEDGHHRFVDAPAEADDSPMGDAAVDALEARREGLKNQIQNCHQSIANLMTRIEQQRAIIAKYELESAQITDALEKLAEPRDFARPVE